MNKFKDIEDLESYLNKSVKSTGFKTPDSYFTGIEDRVSLNLFTENLPKETGYKVTDDYFNSIENQILKKTTQHTKVLSLRKRIVTWIPAAAAACIVLFLALNYSTKAIAEPNNEEIFSWFENDLGLITEDDLVLALEDGDIEASNFTSLLNENTIENYLQNIDTSDIINEFEEE